MNFLIKNSSDKSVIKKLETQKDTPPLDSGIIDIDNYMFDDEKPENNNRTILRKTNHTSFIIKRYRIKTKTE